MIIKRGKFSWIFSIVAPLISIVVTLITIHHTNDIVAKIERSNSYDVVKTTEFCMFMEEHGSHNIINDCVGQRITYYADIHDKTLGILDKDLNVIYPEDKDAAKCLRKLPEDLIESIRESDEGTYFRNFGKYIIDASFAWVHPPSSTDKYLILYMMSRSTFGFSLLYALYYINIAISIAALFKSQFIDRFMYAEIIMDRKNQMTDDMITRTYDDLSNFH